MAVGEVRAVMGWKVPEVIKESTSANEGKFCPAGGGGEREEDEEKDSLF